MKLPHHNSDASTVESDNLSPERSPFKFRKNISQETAISPTTFQSPSGLIDSPPESVRRHRSTRLVIFIVCLSLLVIGRFNVPFNTPPCVVDYVQDMFQSVTTYIFANPSLRNALQILCSLFMDVMFFSTCIYWILHGTSSRLFVTTITFFVTRAIVQQLWNSPFPTEYWWNDPGFPSFVVPYGEGSDFFFSGHIGFVTICANEWRKNKFPRVAKALVIGAVYTGFILLVYHVHYSIDLFAGVFFAQWLFIIVNKYKDELDAFFIVTYYKLTKKEKKSSARRLKDTEQGLL